MRLQTTPLVLEYSRNGRDPSGRVLKMTTNRYWTNESIINDEGFSLIFAHCIGAHKEQWEPVIEQTFRTQQSKPKHHRVREAWAFNWQNHGDAALLNRDLLVNNRAYGRHTNGAPQSPVFFRSPRMQGKHIVAIGHSAGAGAMLVALKTIALSNIPYVSLVLVEPTMASPAMFYRHIADSVTAVVAATMMRRERWRSRDDAFTWLARRAPRKRWDKRVLRSFIEHGLVDTPDGDVTLKCDRRQEASAFPDVHPHFSAVNELTRICRDVPIHIVWASRSKLIPRIVQDSLSDASEGRHVASITRLEGGHMIVQEAPDRIASAICSALDTAAAGKSL
ncbi:Alpha/Beta hydrolase protein [Mycena alexandri]|uniref:Alpha/Beta hydrolase protein n=1 Tax=Mycena alexandri TaxID=1745969 RepID=A0AAD6RYT9_9AGAR|nr:Alpha/Beta hydrolase protein [Mycena alexandri]